MKMPLMQGKSPKAFTKNIKTEMNAGKPQKQALAIAYAVKRRAGKKMAEGGKVTPTRPNPIGYPSGASMADGGMAMGRRERAMKKMAEGGMVENEDLNARNEPEHGAENDVLAQQRYSHEKLSHGQVPHDKEPFTPMASPKLIAQMVMLKKSGEYPDGRPEEEGDHFAHGGMAKRMASGGMMKKDDYAFEGWLPEEPGDHYGEPSTMDYGRRSMFDGGTVDEYPGRHMEESGDRFSGSMGYGMRDLDSKDAGEDDGDMYQYAGGGRISEYPDAMPEEMGDHFADGGMYPLSKDSPKGMERPEPTDQKYYDDRPEDGDSIDNTNVDDHPDNDFLADEEQSKFFNRNQADLDEPEAKMRRKGMISSIMRNLQMKHMGR